MYDFDGFERREMALQVTKYFTYCTKKQTQED